MNGRDNRSERTPTLERLLQTIIVAVTLGALGWTGTTLWNMREELARMGERLAGVQAALADGAADRFRSTDWARERSRLDERHIDLERRVEKLEAAAERRGAAR